MVELTLISVAYEVGRGSMKAVEATMERGNVRASLSRYRKESYGYVAGRDGIR